MKEFTSSIIDFYHESLPRKIWVMDRDKLNKVMRIHDGNHVFLWTPEPNYPDMPGSLLGIRIVIVDEPKFQLGYIFNDGKEHYVDAEFEI